MELVAFLGTDKESWGQISALTKRMDSTKIILVKNMNAPAFPKDVNTILVEVDSSKSMIELKEDMMAKLKPLLSGDFEVALSIASGNGKEHMALISALLSLPVGIRIVAFTQNGVEYLT